MGAIDEIEQSYDVVVVGGGINGAGIARDAAGRGLRVLLCEKDDLAAHTSSASTKLIHGGLRYLQYYDFRLVRHALREREVLLCAAPHIIWPMRFVLPHHRALRPAWLIRLGLFLYDHMGGRQMLPGSHGVDLRTHPAGAALRDSFTQGFEYSDCWVQDSRLVVLNARDARDRGARVLTRTECVSLEPRGPVWRATLRDTRSGETWGVDTRSVVNAAGPWVESVLHLDRTAEHVHRIRLVKGSHVVVPRLFDHGYPYLFQNADRRVLFALPYERDFTLLGTTEMEVEGEPGPMQIEAEEVEYICRGVSEYFAKRVSPDQVVWSYSGVRPLFDNDTENPSAVSRDYLLYLHHSAAPMVSVFGGKITTYRRLAEEVLQMLAAKLGAGSAWTAAAPLPGGDIADANFDRFLNACAARYPWLSAELLYDYARNYGTDIDVILRGRNDVRGLGEHFGGPLYAAEVAFLVDHEWAETAEDILWRRTRKGLHVPDGTAERLDDWMRVYSPRR